MVNLGERYVLEYHQHSTKMMLSNPKIIIQFVETKMILYDLYPVGVPLWYIQLCSKFNSL